MRKPKDTNRAVKRPPNEADQLYASDDPVRLVLHPDDLQREPGQPRLFVGPIASANTLLKNSRLRDALRDQFGVKAVEMEGSGIADATWNQEVGYLVVRGICDYCDSHKNDVWQGYAAVAAAAYTRGLLASMPAEENEPVRHIETPATGNTTVSGQGKYVGRDDNSINVTSGNRMTNPATYNSAALRELLNAAFSDEELTTMCFDHFSEVFNNFSAGMSKGQKIQQLLDYCQRREQIPTLVAEVQARNPAQFARFEGRLRP